MCWGVFCNASVKKHYPVKLSETLCRSYLFQNESALNLRNSLHNPAKMQRKSQWASYLVLLLSWNTRAFPLIYLHFCGFFCLPFQWLSWESLQNSQKLKKRKIQCWRRKAEQQVNVLWNWSSFSKTTFLSTVCQEWKHAFGLSKVICFAIRTLGTSQCLILIGCYFRKHFYLYSLLSLATFVSSHFVWEDLSSKIIIQPHLTTTSVKEKSTFALHGYLLEATSHLFLMKNFLMIEFPIFWWLLSIFPIFSIPVQFSCRPWPEACFRQVQMVWLWFIPLTQE